MRPALACLLTLFAAVAVGAPPVIEGDRKADAGKMLRLSVKLDKGQKAVWAVYPPDGADFEFEADGRFRATALPGKYHVTVTVAGPDATGAFDLRQKTEAVEFGSKADKKVTPDKDKVAPKPKVDPKPKVEPVTSFKVLFVYESGATHTAAEKAVMEGRAVEEWLTANCTGGKGGWLRRDKDTDPAADTTEFRGVWAAVKADLDARPAQKYPCVAVVVNNKATIDAVAATPAEMVKVLAKYREGK